MATIEVIFPSGEQTAKILKWRVGMNAMVSMGRVLFLYNNETQENGDTKNPEKKFRATRFGRVKKLLAKEGDVIKPGQAILILEGCKHPTVMKDLCAECGVDLRIEGDNKDGKSALVSQATVPMVHSVPELKVCLELAEKIGKEDEQRLLKDHKLALLVDLDQTIVHTTNDNVSPNMKDVYHYQLYGTNSPWYHTRLRPNTRHFLLEMSHLYELHICTFGARNYAHTVAALLDKDGTLFSHRILSRDECFDPASKTANLKALFPCGDDMVCIIDDREDVWQGCGNLVQVKAYHFFRHTGDIHAPPGLEKKDPPSVDSGVTKEVQTKSSDNGLASQPENEDASLHVINDAKEDNTSEKKENDSECDKEIVKATESVEKPPEDNLNLNKDNAKLDKPPKSISVTTDPVLGKTVKEEESCKENNLIDEDDDDYLLYLEDILRRIHAEFYSDIEKDAGRRSLRDIIPCVRARVLKGLCLTFSGLIPTHQKLHQSRVYKVARAFGAEVTQDLTGKTTHLVAIKPGTAKVNIAKKKGNIKIVNPDWLWTSTERWEHVDERLFPLTTKARASRIPPPHCSSPEHIEQENVVKDSFADSINPLMSFTQEEIEFMDKEVEQDMEDQEMEIPIFDVDEDDLEEYSKRIRRSDSSESEGSMNEDGIYVSAKKKKKFSNESTDDDSSRERNKGLSEDDDDDDDDLAERFRRGELPSDLDMGDNSQDSIEDLEAVENEDDREWNAMGAALEREFLSE